MRLKEFVQETGGSTGNFLKIDPRVLRVRPDFNLRDLTTPAAREKLDILKAQIKAEGVLEPLEIEFDGETPWINEGHRRHMMVMELIEEGEDFRTIPCIQERSNIKPAQRTLHMLMRSKEDYEPLEYAKGIERMVNVYGWDKANLARSLGFKSKGSIDGFLDMLGMSDEIKEQVRSGTVSATAALKVSRDTQTPEELKAKIIQDAADEQKRLGKKGKATPKALTAAKERRQPKPPAEPKAETATPEHIETWPNEPEAIAAFQTAEPVSGSASLDQLRDQIAGLTETRSAIEAAGIAPLPPAPVQPSEMRVVTLPQRERPEMETVSGPDLRSLFAANVVKILGKLATIAADSALDQREPDETLPVPIALLAECEHVYRQMIGDVAA